MHGHKHDRCGNDLGQVGVVSVASPFSPDALDGILILFLVICYTSVNIAPPCWAVEDKIFSSVWVDATSLEG